MKRRIAIVMLAMLAIGSFSFMANPANADTQVERLGVHMRGVVTQWGSEPVFGWIGAHVGIANLNGTHREWARVHAVWSNEKRRLNCSEPRTPENFTFSFYTTRLVESSEIKINYSGYDLFISGLWNVARITTTILVNENNELISFTRTFEPIVTNATGELHVFANWHRFELSITGMDLLSGMVVGLAYRYFELKVCDTDDDGKVDLIDLTRVAKRYGAMPGMSNYNHDFDFNFDEKIDIGDLTTLAANIE